MAKANYTIRDMTRRRDPGQPLARAELAKMVRLSRRVENGLQRNQCGDYLMQNSIGQWRINRTGAE